MFKSVFLKYYSITAAIIGIVFIVSACAQSWFAGNLWLREKQTVMTEHAENVTGFLSENALEALNGEYLLGANLEPMLQRLADSFDGHIVVTNRSFEAILFSDESLANHIGKPLPPLLQSAIKNGTTFTVAPISGFYEDNQYCATLPLKKGETLIGYVLVTSSAKEFSEYIWQNVQVILISGTFVLLIAFVALYVLTYRMVQPLRQMAIATRHFSQGDFSYRVKVRGKDEVAELATALNHMAVSLSSVEEMRRSFIGNVSHELRTPMTTIAGFIDGMLDGTIPLDRHREYLQIVSDETKRLSRLVQSMLDLSRIDSGQLRLSPVTFDITSVVCNTLFLFEKRIDEKRIEIEGLDACSPQFVKADFDLIQQVVYNLLDNAVKFTENGGQIRLSIFRQDERTYCVVRNTGAGIPSTELPHIFERFYKSDRSRSLDKNGTGLGLYIVKFIVDLHGGEITVSSREHDFCEFRFWLPDGK